jgi:hypothetical protein
MEATGTVHNQACHEFQQNSGPAAGVLCVDRSLLRRGSGQGWSLRASKSDTMSGHTTRSQLLVAIYQDLIGGTGVLIHEQA